MEPLFHIIAIIGVLVAGLMVGNEIAIAAFVHPMLYRLSDAVHAQTAKALDQRLGKAMPVWYAATLVTIALLAFWARKSSVQASDLMMVSAALVLATIVCTIFFLVPINNRIAAWNLADLPVDWKRDRQTWDRRHQWRIACLTVSFALLLIGLGELPR